MTKNILAPWHGFDVPIDSVIAGAWRPLNSVDLQFLAKRTALTISATPRSVAVPVAVREAIVQIMALTKSERRGLRHHRHWSLLIPENDGMDPDDFPVDPLGVAAWPWREQMRNSGWDTAVAEASSPIGPWLILGSTPRQPEQLAAGGGAAVRLRSQ